MTDRPRIDRALGYALEALIAFLILFTPLAYGTVEIWSVSVLHAVSVAIVVLWAASMIRGGRVRWMPTPLDLCVLLFLALVCLSASVSTCPYASRIQLFRLFNYAFIFWVLVNAVRRRCVLLRLVWLIVIFGSAYATVALTTAQGPLLGLKNFSSGRYAISLTFVNQDHFAGYLGMVCWLGVGLALGYRGARRGLLLGLSVYMAVAVLFSLSRGGALAMAGGSVFLLSVLAYCHEKRKQLLLISSFLVLVGAFVAWLGVGPVLDRLGTLADPLAAGRLRLAIWSGTIDMIAANPWSGTGPGTYIAAYSRYQKEELTAFAVSHAHNDYLELTAEVGIPGLLSGLLCIGVLFAAGIKNILSQQESRLQAVGLGAFTACFAFLIHGAFEFNLHIPANALLFVMCAAFAMLAGRLHRQDGFRRHFEVWLPGRRRWLAYATVLLGGGGALAAVSTPQLGSTFAAWAEEAKAELNLDLAATYLKRATELDPGNSEHMVRLGDLMLARGTSATDPVEREQFLSGALGYYQDAINACPVRSYYQTKKAFLLARWERHEEAGDAFRAAAELAPMSKFTHYDLGTHYLLQGLPDKGYPELRRALELDGQLLPIVLDELWEVDPSHAELELVIPDTFSARTAFARYLAAKGHLPQALEQYAFGFSLEPTLDNALTHLRRLSAHGQHAAALEAGQQYLNRFGQDTALQQHLAKAQIGLGKLAEAIAVYESLFEESPADGDLCLALHRLLRAAGRQKEAARTLNEGLSRRPDEARLHVELALVSEAMGDLDQALKAMKKAVVLRPRNTHYRYRLGKAYSRRGLYQQALEEWARCLELDPQHAACQRARTGVLEELGM